MGGGVEFVRQKIPAAVAEVDYGTPGNMPLVETFMNGYGFMGAKKVWSNGFTVNVRLGGGLTQNQIGMVDSSVGIGKSF